MGDIDQIEYEVEGAGINLDRSGGMRERDLDILIVASNENVGNLRSRCDTPGDEAEITGTVLGLQNSWEKVFDEVLGGPHSTETSGGKRWRERCQGRSNGFRRRCDRE